MLIERGADVTAQNNDGETPLHLALQRGQVDVARMLIERGADVTAQNNDGETPLHLA
jgi:ankyrin repeat protein